MKFRYKIERAILILGLALMFGCSQGCAGLELKTKENTKAVVSPLHIVLPDGHIMRQCSLPVIWTFSANMPRTYYAAVKEAFDYWDNLTSRKLFYEGGDVKYDPGEEEAILFGTIGQYTKEKGYPPGSDITFAQSHLVWRPDSNCIFGFTITVYGDPMTITAAKFQGALRHEVGHILGFNHNDNLNGLMYYSMLPLENPITEASEEELEVFYEMYGH